MSKVTIEIQYSIQRSGKDKIRLRIDGDIEDLIKIKMNPATNSVGERHMEGYTLVIDCEEQYDNHLAFEGIISQICSGLSYRYTFADMGVAGRPSTGSGQEEYPIKLTPSDGVILALYEKSLIYKMIAVNNLSEEAFSKQASAFMKVMAKYGYRFKDKFTITTVEENGAQYLRTVLQMSAKGKEQQFITDMQKK